MKKLTKPKMIVVITILIMFSSILAYNYLYSEETVVHKGLVIMFDDDSLETEPYENWEEIVDECFVKMNSFYRNHSEKIGYTVQFDVDYHPDVISLDSWHGFEQSRFRGGYAMQIWYYQDPVAASAVYDNYDFFVLLPYCNAPVTFAQETRGIVVIYSGEPLTPSPYPPLGVLSHKLLNYEVSHLFDLPRHDCNCYTCEYPVDCKCIMATYPNEGAILCDDCLEKGHFAYINKLPADEFWAIGDIN